MALKYADYKAGLWQKLKQSNFPFSILIFTSTLRAAKTALLHIRRPAYLFQGLQKNI